MISWTARAAASALLCIGLGATAETLTLDDALERVLERHPDLQFVGARQRQLEAERDRAALRPAKTLGAELENVLGTGEAAGIRGAELTLSLASVLERGGKLDARRALANARIDALAIERETRRLDLLADVARRYLTAVGADAQRMIAIEDIAQRRRAVSAASARHAAGATPRATVLSAEVALARAELERDRMQQRAASARQHLASLWGERAPTFDAIASPDLKLDADISLERLAAYLEQTPELEHFAAESRVREARLRLARTAVTPDLEWSVGARRLEASNDVGFVGSVSLPLGARERAQPEIRLAAAEIEALELERDARELTLYATLVEAHGRYATGRVEADLLERVVIPKLAEAEAAAEHAYRAGAASYLEWSQLQSDRMSARRQQLEATLDALRALIEIQRLTGQPFVEPARAPLRGES